MRFRRRSTVTSGVTPYHLQDDPRYCGPACGQMVLQTQRIRLANDAVEQYPLWNLMHPDATTDTACEWGTSPQNMVHAFATILSDSIGAFHIYDRSTDVTESQDTVSREIVRSLYFQQVPPIVLAYGQQHWVLVVSAQVDRLPDRSGTSFQIYRLKVYNPFYVECDQSLLPPGRTCFPPHSNNDACVSQSLHPPNSWIEYQEWKDTYLTPTTAGCDAGWDGLYVAVLYERARTRARSRHAAT